jgi:hypothetical protein
VDFASLAAQHGQVFTGPAIHADELDGVNQIIQANGHGFGVLRPKGSASHS